MRSNRQIEKNWSEKSYPESLRRIRCWDSQTRNEVVLLMSNFLSNAAIIAKLYKKRWQIELFSSGSNSI
jgi:hypothetical protein